MASITIGSLDAAAADELRIRALANDCTLEEEARNILCFALTNLGDLAAAEEARHGNPRAV